MLGSSGSRQPGRALRQSAAVWLEFFFIVTGVLEHRCFVRDADAVVADSGENGSPGFGGQHLWRENAGKVPREKLDEKCGNMRRRVRYRRRKFPLPPDLQQVGEHTVASY